MSSSFMPVSRSKAGSVTKHDRSVVRTEPTCCQQTTTCLRDELCSIHNGCELQIPAIRVRAANGNNVRDVAIWTS